MANNLSLTSAPYKIGDYYNDGTKQGIVFEVWDNGNSGKIVSLIQSPTHLQWASEQPYIDSFLDTDDKTYGANNLDIIMQIPDWQTKFPAFKWCTDLGEGWYLPAKDELMTIYQNKEIINRNPHIIELLQDSCYWSSTEDNCYHNQWSQWGGDIFINGVCMNFDYSPHYQGRKYFYCLVRAICCFGNIPAIKSTSNNTDKTHGPYHTGSYYNDGIRQGVVCDIWDNGRHGKILSLDQTQDDLQWYADDSDSYSTVGATDLNDGAKNMSVIMQIPDWRSKFPAFRWCADLGEGWYLPAINEIAPILLCSELLETINNTLRRINKPELFQDDNYWYWSSSESNNTFAWSVYRINNMISADDKSHDFAVRAISIF